MPTTPSRARCTRLTLSLLTCALLISTGCGGGGSSSAAARNGEESYQPTARPGSEGDAHALYESKQYAKAKAVALTDAKSHTGYEREVSMLTAGLSAHALRQYDDAATILTPLTRSEDPRIAGRAKTALDYIGIERGRAAAISATKADPTTAICPAPAFARGFTLQAGVFTLSANASKRAAQVRPQAIKAGWGEPRIVPDSLNGRPAYAVRVGSFPTKQAADTARSRLPGQVVVMAIP